MYFTFRFYLLGHLFSSKFQSICPAEFFSHFQKWLWFFGENFWFLNKLEKSWKTCEEYLLTVIWWWSQFLKILILKISLLQWKFWKKTYTTSRYILHAGECALFLSAHFQKYCQARLDGHLTAEFLLLYIVYKEKQRYHENLIYLWIIFIALTCCVYNLHLINRPSTMTIHEDKSLLHIIYRYSWF